MHLWPIVRASRPRSQPHRQFLSLWRPLRWAPPGRAHCRDLGRLGGLCTRTYTRGQDRGRDCPTLHRAGWQTVLPADPLQAWSWTAVACPSVACTPMAAAVLGMGIRDAGTRGWRFRGCRVGMLTHMAPMGSVCAPPIRRRSCRARHVRSSTQASPHGPKRGPSHRARR